MILKDTCSTPMGCYSRSYCDHYFDFHFSIKGSSSKSYYWKVVLEEPFEDQDILFKEGLVDF